MELSHTGSRAGVVHTLESLVAAILFLFLVVAVTQQVGTQEGSGPDISLRTRNVVEALDTGGELRPPVANRSPQIVKSRVENHLPGFNIEASIMVVNATADTLTFSGEASVGFTVNESAVENQVLRLWFDGAAAPNVSVNGRYVENNTGTVDAEKTVDIAGETVDGTNELNISVAATSTVGYSIDIYERYDTGRPPTGTDVVSVTYLVGGRNQSFQPAEVSVQAWQ